MRKRVFKIFAYLYIPVLILSLYLFLSQKKEKIELLSDYQRKDTSIKKKYLEDQFYSFVNNTQYWSTLKYPINFDPLKEHVSFMSPYLEIIRGITDYDQFRFLDLEGNEFFRAERTKVNSVKLRPLQNKIEREYVKNGLALEHGQTYLSQISLNRENGEIEKPHKPVIRAVSPIYDKTGKKMGIVVINFKMKRILDYLKLRASDNNIFLLDNNKRIITSSKYQEDLPYEFLERNTSLEDLYTSVPDAIKHDTTYFKNNHIWTIQQVNLHKIDSGYNTLSGAPLKVVSPTNWKLAQEASPSMIKASLLPIYEGLGLFNFFAIILLASLSYMLQKNRVQKELFYKELEEKNELLTKNRDKLLKNNQFITDMNHRLEIRNEQLSEFNYLVSHNLRAPVTSMATVMDMINNEKEPQNVTMLLPKLGQVTKSIINLTEDISDYVTILDNREIKIDDVNIIDLIEEVKKDFTETLLDNDSFEVIIKSDAWQQVDFSKFYLRSVIHNLMSNAIKYRRENIYSYILFETRYENKNKVLSVSDNGIGIDLEKHGDNLFKLYKRFHRNISGKGMGLFLVKSQLEALDAKITIKSKENVGTTFEITF
ncbi:sensor histidine kinase [Maribacter sp. MMG018]|uniref:sensor histidine kinase n=1 Tax=Maribacter sp. MMG018 TaxID=2822688 RepID=UPI001B37A725|nr:sensor histidine kinase [Maribacter sp. MMG018]MBQ4914667.1 sensor histidine kinase [Maribacter sp. MMG018]